MPNRICRVLILGILLLLVLPLSQSSPGITLAERVAGLEEFQRQQRDWNGWIDKRTTTDAAASQGVQDARVAKLEDQLSILAAREMVIYAFGSVGALIFVVSAPIAWGAYSKRHHQLVRFQRKVERMYRDAGYQEPEDEPDD